MILFQNSHRRKTGTLLIRTSSKRSFPLDTTAGGDGILSGKYLASYDIHDYHVVDDDVDDYVDDDGDEKEDVEGSASFYCDKKINSRLEVRIKENF